MGISIEKIQSHAPGLLQQYQKAGFNVSKHGLEDESLAVYLVLDRSLSMKRHYQDGAVQYFAERILGLAAHFDDDGKVPVAFFASGLDGMDELDLEDYEGKIDKAHQKLGRMTGTNYAVAMDAVVQHYTTTGKNVPALVVFQTDGSPQNRKLAARTLCKYAPLPIFWKFVGFGEDRVYDYDDDEGLGFLQKLDDIPVPKYRPIDNADFFAVGRDPRSMRDSELYNRLLEEVPGWLVEGRRLGIIGQAMP